MSHWLWGLVLGGVVGFSPALPAHGETAGAYRQEGLALRQQARYPAAIAAFEQAVALEPANVDNWVLLGWTQHRAQQHDQAAATLQQALAQDPFAVPTLNALGIVHLVRGNLPAAVASHTWAALLQPDNEIAYYNLSLAFERLGQYDWAIATAQRAAQLEPTNPHPRLALALAQAGNGNWAAAQQAYAEALALNPSYGDVAYLPYLQEAGFSAAQVERTAQLRSR